MKNARIVALLAVVSLLAAALLSGSAHAALPPGPGGSTTVNGGGFTAAPTGCGLLPDYLAALITTNAPWYCAINQQIYGVWAGYLPFIFLVVLLALTIAAMIFMIGAALKNDRIRNFGIGEIYEGMATALIVAFFLYICAVVFGLGPAIAVGPINPYATAFNLISSTLSQAEGLYLGIYHIYLIDSYFVSISWVEVIDGQQIPYLSNINAALYQVPLYIFYILPATALSPLLADAMTALFSQYYLMVFFSIASIPAFLAPGIVLRAILPTRALGGMLMSIGIAFFLVMPTLFALAYYFTAPSLLSSLSTATAQLQRFGTGTGAEQNALSASSPLAQALSGVQSAMNSFWLLALFFPALITAVAYIFITQLADFIGGSSRMGGNVRRFV